MRETKQAEKETMPKQQRGITVEIPGYQKLQMRYLILDYNGTIALDGTLQKGLLSVCNSFRNSWKSTL